MATKGKKTIKNQPDKAVGGIHVYQDDHNRNVYYNIFDKKAYVLSGHEKEFRTYSQRFVFGLIAIILTYLFEIPLLFCGIIGIITYALLEIKFRKFLKKLPQFTGFVPSKRTSIVQKELSLNINKIILKAILTFILGILLIVNAQISGYTGAILYLNWLLSALAFMMCIVEIRVVFLKSK